MEKEKRLHPVVVILSWIFLITFFGGGLVMFVNLFVHFLNEGVFAIIALVIMAELVVLLVVAKTMQVISALRHAAESSSVDRDDTDAHEGGE
jgi:hypothetical protein